MEKEQWLRHLKKWLPTPLEKQLRKVRDNYLRKYRYVSLPEEVYQTGKTYKISFCTTCMNRLFHLRQTYLKNIKDNISYPQVEFVLIDYNSQDGLEQWAQDHLAEYINSGKVTYYKTSEPTFFHASIAKNLAHKLASGDILCNLDGDNFTGKDFAFYINYLYQRHGLNALLHFRKEPYWGVEGRIAISADNFYKLGGYDESFLPTGHEDYDLVDRARAFGLDYRPIAVENFLRYLSNSTKEKAENCGPDYQNYYHMELTNKAQSHENIRLGKLVANPSGVEEVVLYKNFTTETISVK